MPTLYVENFPADLYKELRARARGHRRSLAAEVISVMEETVPTQTEMRRRKRLLREALRLRSRKPLSHGPFPSTEEMVREDRAR